MRKRSIYRGFLIAVGLLAAAVIILSNAYSLPIEENKKAETEQSTDNSGSKTISAAPADAVTQGSLVRVDERVPVSVLEILGEPQQIVKFIPRSEAIFNNLFKLLFQGIIAPNAP